MMPKRIQIELVLPDEVLADLHMGAMETMAREAFVMALLREHRISQGSAAAILGVNLHGLFDLMSRCHVPLIDLSTAELKQELEKPFPHS